jgi:hypothetical protein
MGRQDSPYLRLHKDDPVAWQAWGGPVMDLARQQNKLVFISIGYFSCHWCHVMQRESYSDQAVADQLNEHFIAVKVDRELNPALDAYLIEFVQRTRGQAGWPLNVILSPDGFPVIGMTYLPKAQFLSALKQTAQLWQKNGDFIRQMSRNAAEQLQAENKLVEKPVTDRLAQQLVDQFVQQALQLADELSGGFGAEAKFPMTPQLQALLNHYERKPQVSLKEFLQLTLDQMATQGMRDHIGGGFFRYTVDPTWQTPHFEKMLYENASLALLYMRAATLLQRPDYFDVARETLNFMVRELQINHKALASSLSAVDSEGIEGGYYLWQAEILNRLLNDKEYQVLSLLWNVTNTPPFDAGYLPHYAMAPNSVAKKLGISVDDTMKIITEARTKLFQARQQRSIPVDTKQLAGWNGLALQAFASAVESSPGDHGDDGKKFRAVAKQIRDYLVNELWNGKTLSRAKGQSGALGEELLQDYAFAARGLWQWYQLTGDRKDLELVKTWVDIAWRRFYGDTGWRHTDRPLLPGTFGNAIVDDAPLPSASATIVALSLQLATKGKDVILQRRIAQALKVGHELLQTGAFYYPTQIETMLAYVKWRQIADGKGDDLSRLK